jgi:hypothetical protein
MSEMYDLVSFPLLWTLRFPKIQDGGECSGVGLINIKMKKKEDVFFEVGRGNT